MKKLISHHSEIYYALKDVYVIFTRSATCPFLTLKEHWNLLQSPSKVVKQRPRLGLTLLEEKTGARARAHRSGARAEDIGLSPKQNSPL